LPTNAPEIKIYQQEAENIRIVAKEGEYPVVDFNRKRYKWRAG